MTEIETGASPLRRALPAAGVAVLLAVLCLQLGASARRQSQTFDEGAHIVAGFHYWRDADFGVNPEHPPLVKLAAAIPLLREQLQAPPLAEGYFKMTEYASGRDFLQANDGEAVLFSSRMGAAGLTVLLALAVFAAGAEMFGLETGLLALLLLVFEPNLLAHGALVTTDVGVTCGLFLAVYALYRYVRKPSWLRLAALGVAAGLALAAKHSGVLALPILLLLGGVELLQRRRAATGEDKRAESRTGGALHTAGFLLIAGLIAFAVLWELYGFRYSARPVGLAMTPDLTTFAGELSPLKSRTIQFLARWRLLPEAYLYGLVDILHKTATPTFLLGKVYASGTWLYFPAVFVIKSTLGFLALLLISPLAAAMRSWDKRREGAFLAIPAAFYFLVAVVSGLNLGVRHILPAYPFLLILAACGAWSLARKSRVWAGVVALLVMFHVVSSVRAFPDYIAYSNEIAGGTAGTHNVLSESNVDWGQGLKEMKSYVDQHRITDCWFAYFASPAIDPALHGIPCKPLPASISKAMPMEIVPPEIEGTIFVSATELSGNYWGPEEMNPYVPFLKVTPDASIGGSIFAFQGRFGVPLASAVTHISRAALLAQNNQFEEALAEAEIAVALAPNSLDAHVALGNALGELNRFPEARMAFEKALSLAQSVHPEHQKMWIAPLQMALQQLPG